MPFKLKKGNTSESPSWSFNMRSFSLVHDDSGSDNDTDPGNDIHQNISVDAKLAKELDLSARIDKAEYKPNPWSIARINAASRLPTSQSIVLANKKTSTTSKRIRADSGPSSSVTYISKGSPGCTVPTPVKSSNIRLAAPNDQVPSLAQSQHTRLNHFIPSQLPIACTSPRSLDHSVPPTLRK